MPSSAGLSGAVDVTDADKRKMDAWCKWVDNEQEFHKDIAATVNRAFACMSQAFWKELNCEKNAIFTMIRQEYCLGNWDSRYYSHKLLFCEFALRHAFHLWGYCTVEDNGKEDRYLKKQVQMLSLIHI